MKSVAKKISRPKITFYAKQTQFPKNRNECNFCCNKTLYQYSLSRRPQKRTQNEPKRTNFNLFPLPILTLAPMLAKSGHFPASPCNPHFSIEYPADLTIVYNKLLKRDLFERKMIWACTTEITQNLITDHTTVPRRCSSDYSHGSLQPSNGS